MRVWSTSLLAALVFALVAGWSLWNRSNFDSVGLSHEDLLTSPEMRERVSEHGFTLRPTLDELLDGCIENFVRTRCVGTAFIIVDKTQDWRDATVVSKHSAELPDFIVNRFPRLFESGDPIAVEKYVRNFDVWYDEVSLDARNSGARIFVSAFPEALARNFYRLPGPPNASTYYFFIWVDGRISGVMDVGPLGDGLNTQLAATIYFQSDAYQISIGLVPAINVHAFSNQLSNVVSSIADVPEGVSLLGSETGWRDMEPIALGARAEKDMLYLVEKLGDNKDN